MKKKIIFAALTTCFLFAASSMAFSQDDREAQKQESPSAPQKATIEQITPDLNRLTMAVTLSDLNAKEEYHLLLYDVNGQLLSSFWVDEAETTLFVGNLFPGKYALVLMENQRIVDRKEVQVK